MRQSATTRGILYDSPSGEDIVSVPSLPRYEAASQSSLPQGTSTRAHYHTGGHPATPADWKAFLDFAGKYLKAKN